MRLYEKLMRFLSGRYGADELFVGLTALAAVLAVCNLFIRNFLLQIVVYGLFLIAVFRFLSRNIEQRRQENERFRHQLQRVQLWGEVRRKQKNDPLHVYKRCPACKAILRLPRRRGKHETICPKCGKSFSVTVRKK